jgi:hypothetical protein
MSWIKDVNDDLYDPSDTDMLRVAFTSEFKRGRLQDLVALLSGRNFETKQFEEVVAEQSFARLRQGGMNFMDFTHFDRFIVYMRSAGFANSDLIGRQNAVNFAYIIFLRGRADNLRQQKSSAWFADGISCPCSPGGIQATRKPHSISTSVKSTQRALRNI